MTAPEKTTSSGFSPQDWASMIKGIGEGTSGGMAAVQSAARTRQEARELKRRTLADLLNKAMKRDMALFRTGQEYSDEMADTQSQAMQQVAKGFVNALRGSTGRY